jgi:hypothetical protein
VFSRRHFVIATGVGVLAGGFGVGQTLNARRTAPAAAATAAAPAAPAMVDMPGMAHTPGMAAVTGPTSTSTFAYGGHSVRLTQSSTAAALTIDGRSPIHLSRPEVGKLYTHLLPFSTYDDPKLLVRDVLECTRAGLFII